MPPAARLRGSGCRALLPVLRLRDGAAAADQDDRVRRVAGRLSGELRAGLAYRLGASRHDRVGEMASTIPARIAATFQLLGRTIALESADASSFVAMYAAITNLRAGAADAVLVVTGQRREGSLVEEALAAKGLSTGHDGSFTLSDGVGALLLKRQSTAVADGDRVYASILDCVLRHEPHRGAFRYSTTPEERFLLAQQCHLDTAVDPAAVRYVKMLSRAGRLAADVTTAGGEFVPLDVLSNNPVVILRNAIILSRLARERRCQVLHAFGRAGAWSGLIAARVNGIRFVTSWHKGFREQIFSSASIMGLFGIFFLCRASRSRIFLLFFVLEQIAVVPCSIDLECFNPEIVTRERTEAIRTAWGVHRDIR